MIEAPADVLGPLIEVIVAKAVETVVVTDGDVDLRLGPTILFANAAATQSSGYAAGELVGKRLGLLYAEDVMPQVIRTLTQVAEQREVVVSESPTRSRSGRIRWLEITSTPIFDKAGRLQHFVRIGRDISARKQIEQQRESTQRLLASVFGVINQPLVVADGAGNLTMANTAVTRRLGWSIFDLMGKPVVQLMAPADRPHLSEMMQGGDALDQTRQIKGLLSIKGKPEVPGEVELTTILQPDGQRYHVLTLRPDAVPATEGRAWDFELAVRDIMKGSKADANVVAGKLQLVGLDEVRESLGDKWPAIAERAFSLAERTIQRHMRTGDVFRRTSEDGFLVLFAHLSENEAQFKARAIADEIREKLTGEIPDLAVAKMTSFAGTVPVDEKTGESEEEIITVIERRLKEERDRVEAASKAALQTGLRKAKSVHTNATNLSGQAAPMIFVRLPSDLREASETLRSLGQHVYQLETETFLLAGAGERVLSGLTKSVGELIVTPVRLATLSQNRTAEAWLDVGRALGEAAKRQIVIEVREVPRDIVSLRLTDLTMRLSSLFKSVAIELPAADAAFVDMLPSQVRLVTIDYARIPWANDNEVTASFSRMVKVLDVRQRRLIVRNVISARRRALLAKTGVSLFVNEES